MARLSLFDWDPGSHIVQIESTSTILVYLYDLRHRPSFPAFIIRSFRSAYCAGLRVGARLS
jgi:hypothetical protein